MPFQAILCKVAELRNVGTQLDTVAGQNPFLSEPLTIVAGNIHNTADKPEVLAAIRGPKNIVPGVSSIEQTCRNDGVMPGYSFGVDNKSSAV